MADKMDSNISQAISTVDPYEHLQITPHPDGTITRRLDPPTAPPTVDPSAATALSKDLPLNRQTGTYVRLYLPRSAFNNPHNYNKLPVVVYYHGGGFVILHADSKGNHDFCELLAATALALVVSVEYRLAPEHRLPAAYDDATEAVTWIKERWAKGDEEWICRYANLSSCFLMGSSAGGNIAYHAGARVTGLNLDPLRIRALILHAPYFGGVDRTESERRLQASDPSLPLAVADLMWELALPKGSDRDHEYCNPLARGGLGQLERVRELGWKFLFTGCTGDLLIDRQVELVKVLEQRGFEVVAHITEGGYHGVELVDPTRTPAFVEVVKKFMLSCQYVNHHQR